MGAPPHYYVRGSASAWEREKGKLCRFLLPLATVERCRVDHDHVTDSFGREQLWTQKHQAQLKEFPLRERETETTSEHCPALKPLFEGLWTTSTVCGKFCGEAGFNGLDKDTFGGDKTFSVEEDRRINLSGHAGVFGVIWRQKLYKQIRTNAQIPFVNYVISWFKLMIRGDIKFQHCVWKVATSGQEFGIKQGRHIKPLRLLFLGGCRVFPNFNAFLSFFLEVNILNMVGEMETKEKPKLTPDYLMQLMNDKKLMSSLPNFCGIFNHLERLLDEGQSSVSLKTANTLDLGS